MVECNRLLDAWDKMSNASVRVETALPQQISEAIGVLEAVRQNMQAVMQSWAIAADRQPPWRDMSSAPKDGTHILAKLHREAINDMDDIRRPAFTEIREIWYRSYPDPIFGHDMPWHAGDPFDSHDGMAPDHFGEDVPIAWMPLPRAEIHAAPKEGDRHG